MVGFLVLGGGVLCIFWYVRVERVPVQLIQLTEQETDQ